MTGRTLARARFVAATLLVAAGCSSGGDGGTQPGETPAIVIAINPTSATVVQGGSTQVTGTITRSGGYTGDVALTVEGLAAGIGGTVDDVSTSNGVTTGTVTLTVANTVAAGAYNLPVRATGSGVSAKTATFALTVTAANAPNYTLAVTPATLSLAQGASGTAEVAVARTNFTGEVALTAEGLPAGVTAAFDPTSATENTSTLTLWEPVSPRVRARSRSVVPRTTSTTGRRRSR
jgi:hypothetical protein